ncbi:integrase [Brevibacillus sp. B_LB10_24]|uniref:integrase n=1 Tax=Brevibacillus sp. B_LB10_24 TaxID=3380645 RepID=UPI0038BC79DF
MTYVKQQHINRLVDRPNTYVLSENGDGTVQIVPAWNVIAGTPVDDVRLNHMEDGIEGAHLLVGQSERRITRLEAYLDIDNRGVSGAQARFADTYDGQTDPVLQLDQTKTYSLAEIAVSTTAVSVQVASVSGLSVGQEVTIASSAGVEDQQITAIDTVAQTVTFPSMQYSHPKGALVARSTMERDTENQRFRIGGWATYTVTIAEA